MIAISFCNENEERVETILMRDENGSLVGEKIKINS